MEKYTSRLSQDIQLSDSERGDLVALCSTHGWGLFERLANAELNKMNLDLINADATSPDAIRAAHNALRGATLYWNQLAQRINIEIGFVTAKRDNPDDVPAADVTEELFS